MWIPSTMLLCVSHLAMYMNEFGNTETSMLLCITYFTQSVVCCVILTVAESGVRAHLRSEMDKEDDRTMMAGFQRILKGLCDGSLILDSKMLVRGSPSSLQRLLSTQKKFEDVNFMSLIPCAESKEKFATLLSTPASSQADDAGTSPPECLRVVLSEGGQEVPVDIFHATLPGLFGADEPHHILALVEDTAGREAPLATHGFPDWRNSHARRSPNRWPLSLPSLSSVSSRGSEAASTAGARSNEVLEVVQELAEATFLVDPGSPNVDLVEAHLKFNRGHHTQQPPSLRMLSNISQWDDLQDTLRSYALGLLRGVPDLPVALHAMQVRIPGAPRKMLKAKHVRLSLANRSREPNQPIFLYLHMKNFINKDARPSYVTGLQSDALEEEDDASLEDGREASAEHRPSEFLVPPPSLAEDAQIQGRVYHL